MISALLDQLDEKTDTAEQKQESSPSTPMDMRGPNGAYSAEYQIMAVEVMSHEVSARAAGPAIAAVQEHDFGVSVKPPSPRSLSRWERKAGLVAEAMVAQKAEEHARLKSRPKVAIQYDESTKFNVPHHAAALVFPDGVRMTMGVKSMPTKSATDQLQANKRMREDIATSAAILKAKAPNLLSEVGFALTDGGNTEAAIRRGLEQEQTHSEDMDESGDDKREKKRSKGKRKHDEDAMNSDDDTDDDDVKGKTKNTAKTGKEEKEVKEEEEETCVCCILGLPCHKHKLSNVTEETERNGVNQTGVGGLSAFDLGYKLGELFRLQSTCGRSVAKVFESFCKSKGLDNHIGSMRPFAHARHHNRWDLFASIFLSLPALREYEACVSTKAKRGKAVAKGEEEVAHKHR